MVSKAEFMDIKKQLSFKRHLSVMIGILVFDLCLFLGGLWLTQQGNITAYICSQLLFALFFLHNFCILHECGHGNVSDKEIINTVIGHYASVFCFLPYYPWKYIHHEHHLWAGNFDKDPTLKKRKEWLDTQKISPLVKFAWRSWVPIADFLQHFVFWGYPIIMRKEGRMTDERKGKIIFSVLLLPITYVTLFTALPELFNFANFGLALVLFLMAKELINFPHHIGVPSFDSSQRSTKLPPWEQGQVTRSCDYPPVFSELLMLNFNFHIEHHFFPTLPWYQLRKARKYIRSRLGQEYNEAVGISWNIENRKKSAEEVFLKTIEYKP